MAIATRASISTRNRPPRKSAGERLRGGGALALALLVAVMAGCGKAEYERRLQATVDNLSMARLKQAQDNQGDPAAAAAKAVEALRGAGGAPPAAPPAGAAPGQNPNQAAAAGAAQGTGLSPVGQAIVAPLE